MTLNLTLEQINLILAALGAQPYNAVAELVAAIRAQAETQLATREMST